MSSKKAKKIVVIEARISGLTVVFCLTGKRCDVRVLEAAVESGERAARLISKEDHEIGK